MNDPVIVQVPLDAVTRDQLASMVYERWSEAFEKTKRVKALTWESMGKFCPKNEWPAYHTAIIKEAEDSFNLAKKLRADVCHYSPLILGH